MEDLDLGATIKGFSAGQKVFDRFTLRRILGRGGMGVVWLAHDGELDRDVALKFLPEVVVHDREAIDELKRETRRNLELTHPNIVRIYDFIQQGGSAAISMEYVNGASLAALKLDQPEKIFPLPRLREWVAQLCAALGYAHEHAEIVHRDLKPANLMIDARGRLKVTDFGIARSLSDSVSRVSAQAGNTSGTAAYMSPQQMMGQRPSVSDDIYALGATLYELLTGKPPFYSGNIYPQVLSAVPPLIVERCAELGVSGEPVPDYWQETIAACLSKEPGERPASMAAVAALLAQPRAAAPVSTRGEDITTALFLTADELARGGPINVSVPAGAGTLTQALTLPSGMAAGTVVRARGRGQPGSHGGEAGDLLVTVHLRSPAADGTGMSSVPNDPLDPVRGDDLRYDLALTADERRNGRQARLRWQGDDGSATEFDVKIPPGLEVGAKLRLRGRGRPGQRGGEAGDLYVVIGEAPPPPAEAKPAWVLVLAAFVITGVLLFLIGVHPKWKADGGEFVDQMGAVATDVGVWLAGAAILGALVAPRRILRQTLWWVTGLTVWLVSGFVTMVLMELPAVAHLPIFGALMGFVTSLFLDIGDKEPPLRADVALGLLTGVGAAVGATGFFVEVGAFWTGTAGVEPAPWVGYGLVLWVLATRVNASLSTCWWRR